MRPSNKVQQKKPYRKPNLQCFGSLAEITQAVKGGPKFDGGTPPFHKQGKKSK